MQDLSRQHLHTENAPCCRRVAQLPMRYCCCIHIFWDVLLHNCVNLLLCTLLREGSLLHFGRNLFLPGWNSAWKSEERRIQSCRVLNYIYTAVASALSAPALASTICWWKRLSAIFILRLIYFLWRMQVAHIFHSGEQLNWGEKLFEGENRR